jgi:hypothetical protein
MYDSKHVKIGDGCIVMKKSKAFLYDFFNLGCLFIFHEFLKSKDFAVNAVFPFL